MMMNRKSYRNKMSVRILLTVIVGMLMVSLLVTATMVKMSKDIFVDTYGQSQEQVFEQIGNNLNEFHENLMKIASEVEGSWAFRLYFGHNEELDDVTSFQTVYQMQADLKQAIPTNIDDVNVMILNKDGVSYINRQESITESKEEILNSVLTEDTLREPERMHYHFLDNGYSATTKESGVLVASRALRMQGGEEPFAVIYITIKEHDFQDFFRYFTSDNTDFYLTGREGTILAGNKGEYLGKNMNESPLKEIPAALAGESQVQRNRSGLLTVLRTDMPYFEGRIYGVIDNSKALANQYHVVDIIVICLSGAALVLLVIFFIVRQTTLPLSRMAEKMKKAENVHFEERIEVTGAEEVRTLALAYNSMLDDLDSYIDKLLETQKEKRRAEIRALQMQINPHYIYNTLASIKWLIWQGDTEKSTRTLDAFIALLRNTISNTDEFIPISQEMENLRNYVLINNTRYGDQVQVEFFVAEGCEDYLIPKLILQPFIENAFFHGFPSGRQGSIQVLAGQKKENIKIEIADDGIGMTQERLSGLLRKDDQRNKKEEHFSGIGINNVDDRLKLLYGMEYGVSITSTEGEGTTVTILLPVRRKEQNF
ncbi:sensor histidine kinase [Blautia schinkii]|nr:sensor histidine kinase [Blautia schinkii]